MRWLARALYPLVGAWALYSLLTKPHKSWWSWAVHSLANGVYTFGFIAMTPQLFVNYVSAPRTHPEKTQSSKMLFCFILPEGDEPLRSMLHTPVSIHREPPTQRS